MPFLIYYVPSLWCKNSSEFIFLPSLQGFQHHVKNEHNMWGYIFFQIHLDDIKPNDYTALDLYVANLVNFISPVGHGISLV